MYKLLNTYDEFTKVTSEADVIIRIEDGASIPFDDANTDYIEYKSWVAAGNTPEAV